MSLRDELAILLRSMGEEERHEVLGLDRINRKVERVAKTVDDLKNDYEAFRSTMQQKVADLQAQVDAAGGVPADVQSSIDALAAEIEGDTSALNDTTGTDEGGVTPTPTVPADGSETPAPSVPEQATVPAQDANPAALPTQPTQSGPIGA